MQAEADAHAWVSFVRLRKKSQGLGAAVLSSWIEGVGGDVPANAIPHTPPFHSFPFFALADVIEVHLLFSEGHYGFTPSRSAI